MPLKVLEKICILFLAFYAEDSSQSEMRFKILSSEMLKEVNKP